MDYSPLLQTLGLTSNEAKVYELLLALGQVQASVLIAKLAPIPRATIYKSLYGLEAKGLVKQEDIHKKLHFSPLPPEHLLELSTAQFELQQRARDDLRSILPSLNSTYILSTEKPVVSTYEGVEGLKKIYEDTLLVGQEILAFVQVTQIDDTLHYWLESSYVKQRTKRKIHAKAIISGQGWTDDFIDRDPHEDRESVKVDDVLYPMHHEIDIYGDKVAFIHFKRGEPLIGIIIDHPRIAATMRSVFALAWKGAIQTQK
ncbi:MAG: helix-turn-helix domain-containing protein [bacterium]